MRFAKHRKVFSLVGWWLAVLAIYVIAVLLPDIWYELHLMQGVRTDEENAVLIGALIVLTITISEALCFLRGLFTGRILSMLRHIVPVLIIAYAFLIHFYPDWGVRPGWSPERARFALFRERYEECAATARTSFGANKFKTCELRIAGNTSFQAIVYDTSGEIGLALGLRSPEFNDYLIRSSESPIYTECGRLVSSELAPHFFYLWTGCY
jgi:hypothetical protein